MSSTPSTKWRTSPLIWAGYRQALLAIRGTLESLSLRDGAVGPVGFIKPWVTRPAGPVLSPLAQLWLMQRERRKTCPIAPDPVQFLAFLWPTAGTIMIETRLSVGLLVIGHGSFIISKMVLPAKYPPTVKRGPRSWPDWTVGSTDSGSSSLYLLSQDVGQLLKHPIDLTFKTDLERSAMRLCAHIIQARYAQTASSIRRTLRGRVVGLGGLSQTAD